MCGSMADIQSVAAVIRRGKKERRQQLSDIVVIHGSLHSGSAVS